MGLWVSDGNLVLLGEVVGWYTIVELMLLQKKLRNSLCFHIYQRYKLGLQFVSCSKVIGSNKVAKIGSNFKNVSAVVVGHGFKCVLGDWF